MRAAAAQARREAGKHQVRVRVRDQLRARLGKTLDVVDVCEELADAVVHGFADIAVVEVVDSVVRGEDPPLAPAGRDVPLRRAAFGSASGEAAQAHPVGDVRKLPFPGPYAQVLTDLKARLIDLKPGLPWLHADPERAAAIRASGARMLLVLPLTLGGTVLGLLSLYRGEEACVFDAEDIGFAETMAAVAALAIDRGRLYTREHTVATALQHRLLRVGPSSQTGLETAGGQVAGEAGGGGWAHAFPMTRARTGLVVGEVTGHGLLAAAALGQLRTAFLSLATLDLEPDELFAQLNDTVVLLAAQRAALPASDPSRREPLTASGVYAVYDPLAQTCTYAQTGAPGFIIVAPDGSRAGLPDTPAGPPLGTTGDLPFTTATVSLDPGSIIALYTHSILPSVPPGAADDGSPLLPILASTQRSLQDLCDEVIYSLPDGARPGDAVLQLARTHTFPAGRIATWQFGPGPETASWARAQARHKLAGWHIDDDTAQATELIVSELLANAIRHGTPPMWLRLIKDLTITCEVHDASPVMPYLRHPGALDEFGRGLLIIGRIVTAWGTHRTPDGKTVWAEVALDGTRQAGT